MSLSDSTAFRRHVMPIFCGVIAVLVYLLNDARHNAISAALRADVAEAQADSTARVVGILDDSLVLVTRRAIQAEVARDSIDRKLNVVTRANIALSAHIPTVKVDTTSVVTLVDSVRSASFSVYEAPFHVDASVTMPLPPDSARASFVIRADTARVGLRLSCSQDGDVKQARAFISGPEWLNVNIDNVRQDPVVCNSSIVEKQESRSRTKLVAVSFAVGALAALILK